MKRILIVEDDQLVADVYSDRLRAAGFAVDVAADGRAGLMAFQGRRPDLVLLDLMLPHMNGVEVLTAIRSQFGPRDVPVLVFTNSFIGGMVQQAWEVGASQVITKATMTPKLAVRLISDALDIPSDTAAPRPSNIRDAHGESDVDATAPARFLEAAPEALAGLWEPLKALVTQPKNLMHLRELGTRIHRLTVAGAAANLHRIAQLSIALEALTRDLLTRPRYVTPSVLLTIAQALDSMRFLFDHAGAVAWQRPPAGRILVVDDDEFTRQAVKRALKSVGLHVTCAGTATRALQRSSGNRFDAILLDIELPDTNGFTLCSQLRDLPQCQRTPIIFLTMHGSFEQRSESVLRGGDDFITKPFLFSELAVKVLSFAVRGPIKSMGPSNSGHASPTDTFSRRDVNALKQALLGSLDRDLRRSTHSLN